ncbi:MAG: SUMF1/EgtB/PvdO family nonheme iron enzyme [bacterium]|nr:SUMF1/EgtB/PvdO family nonheme iron enzyme [bacterium]
MKKTLSNNYKSHELDNFSVEEDLKELDRYKNLSLIGEGGLARVYKGYDPKLDRYIAIKILRRGIASNDSAKKRFKQEIKVLSNIDIAGCVKIYDCGEENDYIFYVMEYIEGKSLDKLIKENSLSFNEKLKILQSLSKIIKNIHKQGYEHRDIKPANIIIDSKDSVKLLDFGLARAIEDNRNLYTTFYGEFFGTPAYMSPEQTDSKGIRQTKFMPDIYALGITAYELLTNHLPYDIEHLDSEEIAYIIKNEPPKPPREYCSDIPEKLENLILKALDKNPNYRPRSNDFHKNLNSLNSKKSRTNNRKRVFYISLGCAAAIIIICGIMFHGKNIIGKFNSLMQHSKKTAAASNNSFTVPKTDINMVKIPAGSFINKTENRKVIITNSFFISKYEITNKQYSKLFEETAIDIAPDKPVTNISWHQAVKYCRLLTVTEKEADRLPKNKIYRLPTEAEWEYACSGGAKDIYFHGAMKERLNLYAVQNTMTKADVGSKRPNKFGLYDTLGNVWEWCYDSKSNDSLLSVVNPVNKGKVHSPKAIRGGSAWSTPEKCTVSERKFLPPHYRSRKVGFRIVLGRKI